MSVDAGITCSEVVELLTGYLDGELPVSEHARVAAHLGACDGCSMVLEELRETIRLTGMLTEEQLGEDQRATLLAAFRDWRATA